MNKQEKFWKETYASEYISRNKNFDLDSGIKAWAQMTKNLGPIDSVLECGCNIGRNINILNHLLPNAQKSVIEISPEAFSLVTKTYELSSSQNCSILESNMPLKNFDLVFTTGVLIHIAPENLLPNLEKIYNYSKKYILFCEMFSRVPRTVTYKGENDLLFTRDYGRFFAENFPCRVVDYGFLWGYYFDSAGFDDGNFWVFEKTET